MRKVIYFLVLVLAVKMISAITLYENTTYNPSESNTTYNLTEKLYGITVTKVNETCLTINSTLYCTLSSTPTVIDIPLPPAVIPEEEPVVGAGASGAAGARGGTCDTFADRDKICYFPNSLGECTKGCQEGYICNQYYRCVLNEEKVVNTLDYYIRITTSKEEYKLNENIIATITLINKNKDIDNEGILTTYLINPLNEQYKFKQYYFDVICPVCSIGEYDSLKNLCTGEQINEFNRTVCNNSYTPQITEITRKMAIPINSTLLGEWIFYVSYESKFQSPVRLYDRFKVKTHRNYLFLLIPIPIILVLLIIKRRVKIIKRKKKKKEENAE